ncbi:hypothetical protein BKP45_03310 [Anaerobacillus alkalidiazotrophicus]|uniref:PPM-type phosphatase domain-containing protein n=1 Tax=Anaerobacillus alkalidiazotrophicus TaxID=472963 RepID=A0A1S2MAX4_9BACI|nr:protein phosphatase 2C domain-containing protein [Anaerobacillus alkalidiazotrophicus]OIJ21740.1 hypothetical protein BKP45_03310 [Anaerobacillus alkalidiazotrophicus]
MTVATTDIFPQRLTYGYCTEKGKREENQDMILALPHFFSFAIADGAGGHDFGRRTSEMTIEAFKTELEQCDQWDTEFLYYLFQKKYKQVNQHIYELGKKFSTSMVTTFSMVNFIHNDVLISNVGDTKIYRIRNHELQLLSKVHNVAHELLERNEITENELKNHQNKHMLTEAIGGTRSVNPYLKISRMQKGDVIIICTDGVYQFVDEATLLSLFSHNDQYTNEQLAKLCQQSVSKALTNGGNDNLSIIAVSFN